MKPEEALNKIDNISNVVAVEIPDSIEIDGVVYPLREDMDSNHPGTITKYRTLYEELRRRISRMSDVPEELVRKAIILRRVVIFLKDYSQESELDEKKRWLEYARRVKP